MKTNELAAALGEKPKAILDAIRRGSLKAEKRADSTAINGERWEITTPLEEARTIMAGRVRRKSYEQGRKRRVRRGPAPAELPKRDLFKPQEAAKMAGITESTMYKWIKENGVQTLRNGRSAYIPRATVVKMRAEFMPPVTTQTFKPQMLTARPDPALHRIEREVIALTEFVKKFARSCGFTEE